MRTVRPYAGLNDFTVEFRRKYDRYVVLPLVTTAQSLILASKERPMVLQYRNTESNERRYELRFVRWERQLLDEVGAEDESKSGADCDAAS